mgnify:FL=1|tara:strand:+ start:434 stop:715 length:282 start_codon:yes stop_codon:yes gene_type:complete
MIRYPSILWFCLIIFSGIFLYEIKNNIINKEIKILTLKKQIQNRKDRIRLLEAELAYLSRPERIEKIAKNSLKMKDILPIDIWDIEDLSMKRM